LALTRYVVPAHPVPNPVCCPPLGTRGRGGHSKGLVVEWTFWVLCILFMLAGTHLHNRNLYTAILTALVPHFAALTMDEATIELLPAAAPHLRAHCAHHLHFAPTRACMQRAPRGAPARLGSSAFSGSLCTPCQPGAPFSILKLTRALYVLFHAFSDSITLDHTAIHGGVTCTDLDFCILQSGWSWVRLTGPAHHLPLLPPYLPPFSDMVCQPVRGPLC